MDCANYFRQQNQSLMRAILTAISELDSQDPDCARTILADAWDAAVDQNYKTFILETTP